MRRYLFFVLLVLLVDNNTVLATTKSSTENKEVVMNVHRKNTGTSNRYERTILTPTINVFFDENLQQVTFEMFQVGEANIYIIESTGAVIDSKFVYAYEDVVATLSSHLASDSFYVVIESDIVYAEGYISKY